MTIILALCGNPSLATTDPYSDHPYQPLADVPDVPKTPHIALILPLESPSFGSAANRVKEGFTAATMREEQLPLMIRIYATGDDPLDILLTYLEALSAGAEFVVGPLTRDGVAAIASSQLITVPTLALNTVDHAAAIPTKLFLFGLQMETEASQIAQLAQVTGRKQALVIGDDSSLSKRLQAAFRDRWQQEGGAVTFTTFSNNSQQLETLRKLNDNNNQLVFLALSADKARITRPYIPADVPVYATSQIYTTDNNTLLNNDLNGIRFVDMPWLLQPDHLAVMAYSPDHTAQGTDMERLYALGIDAFRLMTHLLDPLFVSEISFDGVTGYVRAAPGNLFTREPVAAHFEQGKVQLLNASHVTAPTPLSLPSESEIKP
ncbi:MAG: penicillin-binding protein activator [Nitrosomonas sp.]